MADLSEGWEKRYAEAMKSVDVWCLVMDDMRHRQRIGLHRYGKPVIASGSEDWLQHAYEEALDLTVYLRAEIERRKAK